MDDDAARDEWSIGELAEAAGISVRTIRHYDDEGLLTPSRRTAAGHRRYDPAAIGRLYRIVALRRVGFGLTDIVPLLDASGADDDQLLEETARRHLDALDNTIAAQLDLRARLEQLAHGAGDRATTLALEALTMTISLDRITTRTGDDGATMLAGGTRVPKAHPRIEVLGAVDELNAQLGIARAQADVPTDHDQILGRIQQRLFDLGADLATPTSGDPDGASNGPRVGLDEITWVEETAVPIIAALEPLTSFVVPGGPLYAAHLHACRTAARTAERRAVALSLDAGASDTEAAVRYLNRLSDLFFVLARQATPSGTTLWAPLAPAPASSD